MPFSWFAKFQRHRRRVRLRQAGAQIGGGLQSFDEFFTGPASGFRCGPSLYLSAGSRIAMGFHGGQPGRLTIGAEVYVNHYAIINCHHSITVGDRVLIGPFCYIVDFDHGIAPGRAVREQTDGKAAPVRIGDGAWLGAGVIVLKGVSIGAGAVIGAGSVVTRDVPPEGIVAGSPARLLRMR